METHLPKKGKPKQEWQEITFGLILNSNGVLKWDKYFVSLYFEIGYVSFYTAREFDINTIQN